MFLIKFGEEKWINKLRDGEIFMQPICYYRRLEEEEKKKGQGDRYEGKIHINQEMKANIFGAEIKIKNIEFEVNDDEKNLVGCFYNADTNRLKLVDEDEEKLYFEFKFTELERKEFARWGDTALVIIKSLFLEKIKEHFQENNIDAIGNKVKYYNCELPDVELIKYYAKGNRERLLWKDTYFANQNEFRIITNVEEDKGKKIVNINDISDISEMLSIKELLDKGFIVPILKESIVIKK